MKAWCFLTITLVALTLGMSFAHVLELGPKMGHPPALYVRLNNTRYNWFGTAGAAIEVAALVSVAVLAVLVRYRRPARYLTVAAGACQAAALGLLRAHRPSQRRDPRVESVSVPANLTALCAQWEYAHAAHAAPFAAAFTLLPISVLVDTPPSTRDSLGVRSGRARRDAAQTAARAHATADDRRDGSRRPTSGGARGLRRSLVTVVPNGEGCVTRE